MDHRRQDRSPVPPSTGPSGPPAEPPAPWARRRETGRHLLVSLTAATAGLSITLALLSDRLLVLPAAVAVVAGTLRTAAAVRTRWWRWRRRYVGHPISRGAIPRTVARGRPQPEGWPETLVAGTVHVTSRGWAWTPSLFCTDDVEARSWRHEHIVGLRFVPSWGPGLPRSGYVRLLLAHEAPVDLLVHDPDVLGLLAPLPEEVGGRIPA